MLKIYEKLSKPLKNTFFKRKIAKNDIIIAKKYEIWGIFQQKVIEIMAKRLK